MTRNRSFFSSISLCRSLLCILGIGLVTLAPGSMCPPEPPDNGGMDDDDTGDSGITGKFIGSTRCQLCHTRVHDDWAETLHAHALDTLEAIGQDENPNCLPCHTVGFGEDGGFVDRLTTNDLAGVGCESCHGPSRDHAENVNDESLHPPVNLASEVCGVCHTGDHHPHFEEWQQAAHATMNEGAGEDFFLGEQLNNCGKCHSGDFYYLGILESQTIADDFLAGVPVEEMHTQECAICHDPHARTGNGVEVPDGRDFQLRFPEVASPTPTNTIDAATNAARFNLCGQCHHSRGRTWVDTSRGPHHSVQANVYAGEMPVPEDTDPLVLSRVSVHSFANEQCATCHMYRQDFMDEEAPAIAGHTFQVNQLSCATAGCHPSIEQAMAVQATLQTEIQSRLDEIVERLGDPATWEYTSGGGPDTEGQADIPDEIKKVRFMYYYVIGDGSLGMHNPAYIRDMLIEADDLLTDVGQ